MKKLLLIALIALFGCALFATSFTAFAEETTEPPAQTEEVTPPAEEQPPIVETPPTDELPEETEKPILTDEQLQKIVDSLKDITVNNTGLTNEDLSAITAYISELFGGEISETVIIIVICVLAIAIAVVAVLVRKHVKQKATEKQLITLQTQYNNLTELLESFKGDKVESNVINALQNYLDGVKNADGEYLAKIEGELQTLLSEQKAQMDAMLCAWGNKVAGVTNILSHAPTQATVTALTAYVKKLEDNIKTTHSDTATDLLTNLKKEAGL